MTHDIDDLLELIVKLEERIISLEVVIRNLTTADAFRASDRYREAGEEYWEHG